MKPKKQPVSLHETARKLNYSLSLVRKAVTEMKLDTYRQGRQTLVDHKDLSSIEKWITDTLAEKKDKARISLMDLYTLLNGLKTDLERVELKIDALQVQKKKETAAVYPANVPTNF